MLQRRIRDPHSLPGFSNNEHSSDAEPRGRPNRGRRRGLVRNRRESYPKR